MSLSKLAVCRLTKLADYMETVPRKHFNMRKWFGHERTHSLEGRLNATKATYCGSVACAFGWAATIPAFQKAGLSYVINEGFYLNGIFHSFPPDAAATIFDIPLVSANFLFWNDDTLEAIETPKQWARLCRKFLRDNA